MLFPWQKYTQESSYWLSRASKANGIEKWGQGDSNPNSNHFGGWKSIPTYCYLPSSAFKGQRALAQPPECHVSATKWWDATCNLMDFVAVYMLHQRVIWQVRLELSGLRMILILRQVRWQMVTLGSLLLMDTPHISPKGSWNLEYARDHDIHVLCLPPNTTHALQSELHLNLTAKQSNTFQ